MRIIKHMLINMTTTMRIICVTIFLIACCQKADSFLLATQCDGVEGKCDGSMLFNSGIVDESQGAAIEVISNIDSAECRHKCFQTGWCLVAQYYISTSVCELYNHSAWRRVATERVIYYWICCDRRNLCYQSSARCPGYWTSYINTRYVSRKAEYLQTLSGSTQYHCWQACLLNRLCGSINYHAESNTCELNRKWGVDHPTQKPDSNRWASQVWRCCSDDIEKLTDAKTCEYHSGHPICPQGKWTFNTSLVAVPPNEYVVGNFRTQDPYICLQACQSNPTCTKPFYNQMKSWCIIISSMITPEVDEQLDTQVPMDVAGLSFQCWTFSCCEDQNTGSIKVSNNLMIQNPLKTSCLIIVNSSCARLGEFDCTSDTSIHSSKKLWNNMAFYYESESKTINDHEITFLINNGYKRYWLHVLSLNCVTKYSDDTECQIYDGTVRSLTCPKIIQRNDWYGFKPRSETVRRLSKYVVILNSVQPSQSCHSIDHCSDLVRQMQNVHQMHLNWSDIAYNFLIGEDGNVYEGRGWGIKGAHSNPPYNDVSIGICFIGWFKYRKPSLAALNAAKNLIDCAVRENYLDSDYKLVAHRDIRPLSEVPGVELFKIISNWPHYFIENGFGPKNCTEILAQRQRLIVVKIGVSVMVVLISIGWVLFSYHKKRRHTTFCKNFHCILNEMRRFKCISLKNIPPNPFPGIETVSPMETSLSVLRTDFYIITDALDNDCGCPSLIDELAWMKQSDLCSSLSKSHILQACPASILLLLSNSASLFGRSFTVFLHIRQFPLLVRLVDQLSGGDCLCRQSDLRVRQVSLAANPVDKYETTEDTKSYSADWSATITAFKGHYERAQENEEYIFLGNFA